MAPLPVSTFLFHLGVFILLCRTNSRGSQRGRKEKENERGKSANQNNQQHVQLPCSQKLISMLPKEVKEDYVGEIMGQNVTNRLIIF